MSTKGDLINEAYSRGRISGLTAIPSGDDVAKALRRLENWAAMLEKNNMNTGYNFEDDPDTGSPHNLDRAYWSCFESNLAILLLADFGKQAHELLINEAKATFNMMATALAVVTPCQYPTRMPIGSGNFYRFGRWNRFYPKENSAPNSTATVTMFEGDVEDLVEHYDSYLKGLEDVLSYSISSNDQTSLAVSGDSLSSPDISYRVTANTAGIYKVTIVATTSQGRVNTRQIDFVVKEV